MYFSEEFDSLVAFLVGYSEATKQNSGVDLMSLIQEYVKSAYNAEFAILWPYYLAEEVAKGDNSRSNQLVFDMLDAFISDQGLANG